MLEDLLARLHYEPKDSLVLQRAVTHRSFSTDNNERLEFVGDAVLDLVIAESLYEHFPEKAEGELSRYRAELVRSSTLAQIALEIGLNKVLRLGDGERKSGGEKRESILSGALEAVLGAVYLDGSLEECKRIILDLFATRLKNIEDAAQRKDPKTALQELLQSKNKALPEYKLLKTTGKHHHQTFLMVCAVSALNKTIEAQGSSKKVAEQKSAELMLEWINKENVL